MESFRDAFEVYNEIRAIVKVTVLFRGTGYRMPLTTIDLTLAGQKRNTHPRRQMSSKECGIP